MTGDSPAWTDEGNSTWIRPIFGITGMAAISSNNGSATVGWVITNLHGDAVATMQDSSPGLTSTTEATEFGAPRDASLVGSRRYGWLGAKLRAADTPGGLVLMGARLYDTTTGRFLQRDPVAGGSANEYDYCSADPVNW